MVRNTFCVYKSDVLPDFDVSESNDSIPWRSGCQNQATGDLRLMTAAGSIT
ncbi:hypothetical protein NC99_00790 [Sunxiuqinia dokdonensis]|uniref:Uncharacterized protein n=1 Tax=Sunxiuqinia dokdonensis TaxID=1409788 RepID=A0A0L8VFG2_9BACT|nr:hypothetical protein NC99_00790 [Sunxiuqinia dokdonensis]